MKNELIEIIKRLVRHFGMRDVAFAFKDIFSVYIVKEIFGKDSDEMQYILNNNGIRLSDVPSIINNNGDRYWYLNEKLHREDGPAIEYTNGNKEWYVNGKCHREDGPAIEGANGTKAWYVNGQRHRIDGPAIECADGRKEWYIDGKEYSEKEFILRVILRDISIEDLKKFVDHNKVK